MVVTQGDIATDAEQRVEILTIGDELLDGRVPDGNTVHLGRALVDVGLRLQQRTSVTDDIEAIVVQARLVASRGTHICVVSGGLGPTGDDLTAAAFAQLAGVPLVRSDEAAEQIRRWLEGRGVTPTENQYRQADRPQGAELLPNTRGSAPGFAMRLSGCRFVVVPGVPHEFAAMVEAAVLAPRRDAAPLAQRTLCCFGLAEGDVEQRLAPLRGRFPAVRLGLRAAFPEIHVTLKLPLAQKDAPEDVEEELDAATEVARQQLGAYVFAEQEQPFAQGVVATLRRRRETVALAESCTGGQVARLITDVPGSSEVFHAGFVTYHDSAKVRWLGVDPDTIGAHGAVSEQTVRAMARGVREAAEATYGIAVSGIAGPGGGSPGKPVGTVWLALASPAGMTTQRLQLHATRAKNRCKSAYSALDLLRRHLLVAAPEGPS